jgi:hypothetical protein
VDTPVPSIYRYYMCMSLARQEFYKYLPADLAAKNSGDDVQDGMELTFTKSGLFMQMWYGMLFVVVEGWNQSGLKDVEIERLLTNADYVSKLRDFRNAVFHYQKQFLPVKQKGLFADSAIVDWIRQLSDAFQRRLTEAIKAESE